MFGWLRVRSARNGDIVRGAFIIDAHDREIIAWKAVVNAGISGSDIRDIMLEAVERRFRALHAPATIEMLTDKGPPYIAKDTRIFARQLGLKPCSTPIRSPHLARPVLGPVADNGPPFVRTLKRNHVQVTPLPDAQTMLELIGSWIGDYNNHHPHSGLKMRSPREFMQLKS